MPLRPLSLRLVGRHALSLLVVMGVLGTASLTGCAHRKGGRVVGDPGDVTGKYILVLCDADMPATALVDGNLGPRNPEDQDLVTLIGLPLATGKASAYPTPFKQINVSNSVLGPPQAVAVTRDGRWGYVVESTKPASLGATRIEDLEPGNLLTRLDLRSPMAPQIAGTMTVGNEPTAVDISPDGAYLCVATQERRKQIEIIPISENGMGEALPFSLLGLDNDEMAVPTCISWHPTGDFLAVTVPAGNEVVFYRITKDSGAITLSAWGAPVRVGKYPYSGRFTPDGRFYITTDMQWDTAKDREKMYIEPDQGQLSVIRFESRAASTEDGVPVPRQHEVVCVAPVGVSPKGLAISPDGTLVATSNLMQSFMAASPERRIRGGSISLLKMDVKSGKLTPSGEYPIDSMPVGLSFDSKGNHIVVTQFQTFNPNAKTGELAFFKVNKGSKPSLSQTDFFVGVGKGPHGILIVR